MSAFEINQIISPKLECLFAIIIDMEHCIPVICTQSRHGTESSWHYSLEGRGFSTEYRKTKRKGITLASHNGHKQYSDPIKPGITYGSRKTFRAPLAIGFGFTR